MHKHNAICWTIPRPDNFAYEITPPCTIYASFSTIEPTAQRSFTRFSPGVGAGTCPKWLIQQDAALNISLIYYRGVIIKFGQTILAFKLSLNLSLSFSFYHARAARIKTKKAASMRGRGGRREEPMREKTFGRVKQADEFINFKSCQQCRSVGGAFMALPGPPHPSPTCLTPNFTI